MPRQCSYIMCDGYQCYGNGTHKVGKKWYCEDHADAAKTGVDPMKNSIDMEESEGYDGDNEETEEVGLSSISKASQTEEGKMSQKA